MPFENDDNDPSDDDLNAGAKGKQRASRAASGDGGYGAARSHDALETAARQREAIDAQIAAGQQMPDVESNYDRLEMDTNGEFRLAGRVTRNEYDQPGDPFTSASSDAVLNTPQARIGTNNAEAGLVEDEAAELHRAEQRSRAAEQLEVEDARNNGDKAREKEARERRKKMINRAVGIGVGVTLLGAILVPTLLKVFGVIGSGGSAGGGGGGAGGGTKGDAAAPVVRDVTISGLNPNKPTSVDVPAAILANPDPSVDKTSVRLTSSDSSDNSGTRLTVMNAGTFRLDPATGKLDFTPVAYFRGGTAQAGVTIANVSKARSARSAITLEFDTPPLVLDQMVQADLAQTNVVSFNPLTGQGIDIGGAAGVGTHAIDPVSVVFRVPMPLEGGVPQQGRIVIEGGKKATAEGEGVWQIATDGTVTFTRDPAFTGDPTPMTYTVFDTAGIESNVGKLVISSFLTQVTKAVEGLNAMDDASFWSAYRMYVVQGDYGALDTPSEIVGKLTLFRSVHLVIAEITRGSIKSKDRDTVATALPTPQQITVAYNAWAKSGFDLATALSEAEKLSPAGTAADSVPRGARLLRLMVLTRMIGRWQDAMDKAMGL